MPQDQLLLYLVAAALGLGLDDARVLHRLPASHPRQAWPGMM